MGGRFGGEQSAVFSENCVSGCLFFNHTAATAGIELVHIGFIFQNTSGNVVWGSFCCMAGIFAQLFLCISTDSIWYSGNVCVFLYLFSTVAHLSGSCFWNASSDGLVS